MVFTSGPCTMGPGTIVGRDLGENIRTHQAGADSIMGGPDWIFLSLHSMLQVGRLFHALDRRPLSLTPAVVKLPLSLLATS